MSSLSTINHINVLISRYYEEHSQWYRLFFLTILEHIRNYFTRGITYTMVSPSLSILKKPVRGAVGCAEGRLAVTRENLAVTEDEAGSRFSARWYLTSFCQLSVISARSVRHDSLVSDIERTVLVVVVAALVLRTEPSLRGDDDEIVLTKQACNQLRSPCADLL